MTEPRRRTYDDRDRDGRGAEYVSYLEDRVRALEAEVLRLRAAQSLVRDFTDLDREAPA